MINELQKIFLTWLDRFINPNFQNRVIGSLVFGGFTLIFYSNILSLMLSLKWISQDIHLDLSLENNNDWYLKIFGTLFVLLGAYFFYLIHIRNRDKKTFLTLKEASCTIKNILDDNKRIFKSQAPNSSSKTVSTLKNENELTIWDSVKITKIVPNNRKIHKILENIKNYQDNEVILVDAMKNHIEAFEEHCHNKNTDYTKYQFPIKFSTLISKYCNGLIKEKFLNKYIEWINNYLLEYDIKTIEKYLFGSVLYEKNPNDIDILLLIQVKEHHLIIEYSDKLKQMEIEFEREFKLRLHLTVYFNNQTSDYKLFKEKILDIKEF